MNSKVKLIDGIPQSYSAAMNRKNLFLKIEDDLLVKNEKLEQQTTGISCTTNLFFGFFFDGTKNNYKLAEIGKNHSNVARLYDSFPGQSTPDVLPSNTDWEHDKGSYNHFFRVYTPGVSSPFKEVKDTGEGIEEKAGGAVGYKGEERILWALVQAINNVHRYFLGSPMMSSDQTLALLKRVKLARSRRQRMKLPDKIDLENPDGDAADQTRMEFEQVLRRLHAALAVHMPKGSSKPQRTDPAIVQTIHVSIFGFSRGATQARVFSNWLMSLCALDASLCGKKGRMTLAGFDVKFDFLGIFDTVASVGAGNTMGNSLLGRLFDGHGAWADAEDSLRVPAGLPCVHLVAAHELRRSFPLDSIAVRQVLPDNCEEIVVPGVHSDLGGSYAPGEQGRGLDPSGADLMGRIPLIYMYRKARMAGVPLKLEFANEVAKERFRLTPETITAFNAYLAACKVKTGTLTDIMREQAQIQMLWHKTRRHSGKTPLEATASFARASNFDKNDLQSANEEFEEEIHEFEKWMAEKGKGFVPKPQRPGFGNEHEREWEEIATWWNKAPPPPASVLNFFDNYVHDSRAWFKLLAGSIDSEKKWLDKLKDLRAKRQQALKDDAREEAMLLKQEKTNHMLLGLKPPVQRPRYRPIDDGVSDAERPFVLEFDRTGKIPRMKTAGREPFGPSWKTLGLSGKAGYLRYRKIYGGFDSVLISRVDKNEKAVA